MRGLTAFALAACVLTTACGDCAGGMANSGSSPATAGTGSAPSPTAAASNASITGLTVSQTFAGPGATTTTTTSLAPASVVNAASARSTLQVSYDAGTQSYTVTTSGRTQSFAPADARTVTKPGETVYATSNANVRDYLTALRWPITIPPNQSVRSATLPIV